MNESPRMENGEWGDDAGCKLGIPSSDVLPWIPGSVSTCVRVYVCTCLPVYLSTSTVCISPNPPRR